MDMTPTTWQHWCYATLALYTGMAVDADLRGRRIPNFLVLAMLATAVALHAYGPANGREGMYGYFPGALELSGVLLGAVVGLLMFLPLYALRAMGAGDVKFMAALGAYSGPVEALSLGLTVLVSGGVLALALALVKGKVRLVMRNVRLIVAGRGGQGGQAFDPVAQTAERMPYALAFGLGLLVYGYWRHLGHMPFLNF